MPNSYFQFKQFKVQQDKCAMKVTTDGCLFGAWVAQKISNKKNNVDNISVAPHLLDVGTGTGLLPLMLAQKYPILKTDAIEIDEEASRQANENIFNSPWKNQIKIITADARAYAYSQQYDIIISNPPFYENELKGENAKKNIAHHNEGLLLHELLTIIKKNLKPDGRFFMLLPYKREPELTNLCMKHDLDIVEMVFIRQSVNHNFFRIMLSGKKGRDKNTQIFFDEISIWDDKQEYTDAFTSLLKDYYLYL